MPRHRKRLRRRRDRRLARAALAAWVRAFAPDPDAERWYAGLWGK